MFELIATAIVAGKVEIAPDTFQYDVLDKNGQIVRLIDAEDCHIIEKQ